MALFSRWRTLLAAQQSAQLENARQILSAHGVEHRVTVQDLAGTSLLFSGRHRGGAGIRQDAVYRYLLQVRSSDMEWAHSLLATGGRT